MTPDEIAANLRPIRVPADFLHFNFGDALVFLCLGILFGWLVFRIWTHLVKPKVTDAERLNQSLDALHALDREDQALNVARLWREFGAGRALPKNISDALYDPKKDIDLEKFENWMREKGL